MPTSSRTLTSQSIMESSISIPGGFHAIVFLTLTKKPFILLATLLLCSNSIRTPIKCNA